MILAYFDESGDSGYTKSPSDAFVLSGLLMREGRWLEFLNATAQFRRSLLQLGLPMRQEVKSQFLIHGKGPFRKEPLLSLSFEQRIDMYRKFLRFQRDFQYVRVFAVVIDKTKIKNQSIDAREKAWQYAIQRLERFGTGLKENIHLFPDEGHGMFIKRMLRKMRRFHRVPSAFGGRSLDRPAKNIIDDPSDRQSHESYFIQLADLNAYAAYRCVMPSAKIGPDLWDELAEARIPKVNSIRGGPCGIVVWPS